MKMRLLLCLVFAGCNGFALLAATLVPQVLPPQLDTFNYAIGTQTIGA